MRTLMCLITALSFGFGVSACSKDREDADPCDRAISNAERLARENPTVPARYEDGGDGWFVSLGLGTAAHFNYLVGGSDTIDGFTLLKLGVGWEKN